MLDAIPAPDAHARPAHTLATLPVSARSAPSGASALFAAAGTLLPVLEAGRPLDAATLREAMTRAFGANDAEGAWVWKDAYEAAEACAVLFLQRYGRAMAPPGRRRPGRTPAACSRCSKPSLRSNPRTRSAPRSRSASSSFRRPCRSPYAALRAAAVRPGDIVLEPSAGTGMLAVMAECWLGNKADGALHLNEIAAVRAALLKQLFPRASVTRHNAEAIADHLPGVRPTVVLMNPPFSATPGVVRIRHDADLRHLRSAFAMLPPGGRLAAITSAHCVPGGSEWNAAFGAFRGGTRVVFTMAIDGRAYPDPLVAEFGGGGAVDVVDCARRGGQGLIDPRGAGDGRGAGVHGGECRQVRRRRGEARGVDAVLTLEGLLVVARGRGRCRSA